MSVAYQYPEKLECCGTCGSLLLLGFNDNGPWMRCNNCGWQVYI